MSSPLDSYIRIKEFEEEKEREKKLISDILHNAMEKTGISCTCAPYILQLENELKEKDATIDLMAQELKKTEELNSERENSLLHQVFELTNYSHLNSVKTVGRAIQQQIRIAFKENNK